MNEREIARIVRGALDESAERLPYRVARRLAAARAEALANAKVDDGAGANTPAHGRTDRHVRARPHVNRLSTARAARRTAHLGSRRTADPASAPPPRLVWRIAAAVVPVVVVGAGLLGISVWETQQRAHDLAALDAAMLADDVPIAAYADRGFGVFLRNVSWEAAQE